MKILFMCVANSARSQLAEGLAKSIFPHDEIQSAGSSPGVLNPYAVAVMREAGIDLSRHFSKSVEEIDPAFMADLDYVITLCAEEVCPVLISKAKKIHWPHPDPATLERLSDEEALERFRHTRDAIRGKLIEFQKELRS